MSGFELADIVVTNGTISLLNEVSADTYTAVYGWPAEDAVVPFSQPGIVTIPLGFLTLVVVSLLTRSRS